MNIRDAQLVINPDHRFQPEKHRCGYVQVFAVAPGCLPVAAGGLYTCLSRGQIRYLSPNNGKRVTLDQALAEIKAVFTGNYEMTPMSDEMRTIIAGPSGE